MEKSYLILNISPAYKAFTIQVNKGHNAYNIDFDYTSREFLKLKGFMVPCFNASASLSIYGDRETNTMIHCLKVLPKIKDNNINITSFINALIKKEKLNHYQINISGDMSYDNAKPIDLETISTILKEFNTFEVTPDF
jgi:hypothetical protein